MTKKLPWKRKYYETVTVNNPPQKIKRPSNDEPTARYVKGTKTIIVQFD